MSSPPKHAPAPFKLTVAGTTWGLSAKGDSARGGEPDVAQGSTFRESWRYDVALFRAAPAMLALLREIETGNWTLETPKEILFLIRAATTPVKD